MSISSIITLPSKIAKGEVFPVTIKLDGDPDLMGQRARRIRAFECCYDERMVFRTDCHVSVLMVPTLTFTILAEESAVLRFTWIDHAGLRYVSDAEILVV